MIRVREIYVIEWSQYGEGKEIREEQILKDNIMYVYETFEEFIKNCSWIRGYNITSILESLETGVSISDSIKYDPITGVHYIKRSVLLEET